MILRLRKERWTDVVGYEGLYRISTFGRVRSVTRYVERNCRGGGLKRVEGRLLAIAYNVKSGYPFVALWKDGKQKVKYIHQLILEAFVGPCPPGMECLHNDGNERHSVLWNIRWGTSQDNANDRIRHGRTTATINADIVRAMRRHYRESKNRSLIGMARKFGVSENIANQVIHYRTWKWVSDD